MDIKITENPPVDIFQAKRKYQRKIPVLLALIFCAILIAVFQVVFGSAYGDLLENIALVLFVGPALVFFYVVEKLHDYKLLSLQQEKEMEKFCRQDPNIAAYCGKVSMMERKLVKAEYDACKELIEDLLAKKKKLF
jgi:hypothetical protein